MQTLNNTPSLAGQPPPGYGEVLYWRISEKKSRVLLMNLLSLPLFAMFYILYLWLGTKSGWMPSDATFSSIEWLLVLAAFVITLGAHELIHGCSMSIFGTRPIYGFLWKALAFYATSPGYAFPRWQYLIVALAPLVVLSLLAVVIMGLLSGTAWVGVIAILGAVNAAGAIGDLWITTIVLRYPAYAYVMDERDGMRVFMPGEESPGDTTQSAQSSN